MRLRTRLERRPALLVAGLVAVLAIAVPAIAADPSPSGGPPGREGKSDKAAKADRGPAIPKTLRGTVDRTTDGKGRPTFTLTVDGVTWELSAGPKWFHGDNSPLAAHVGAAVEVTGTHREGETELDVETVNGVALRAGGKPPWAGGPKVVGEGHPGWKAWKAAKADGKPGRGNGRADAPGQATDETESDD